MSELSSVDSKVDQMVVMLAEPKVAYLVASKAVHSGERKAARTDGPMVAPMVVQSGKMMAERLAGKMVDWRAVRKVAR